MKQRMESTIVAGAFMLKHFSSYSMPAPLNGKSPEERRIANYPSQVLELLGETYIIGTKELI